MNITTLGLGLEQISQQERADILFNEVVGVPDKVVKLRLVGDTVIRSVYDYIPEDDSGLLTTDIDTKGLSDPLLGNHVTVIENL